MAASIISGRLMQWAGQNPMTARLVPISDGAWTGFGGTRVASTPAGAWLSLDGAIPAAADKVADGYDRDGPSWQCSCFPRPRVRATPKQSRPPGKQVHRETAKSL
jgi:hypothetical protein